MIICDNLDKRVYLVQCMIISGSKHIEGIFVSILILIQILILTFQLSMDGSNTTSQWELEKGENLNHFFYNNKVRTVKNAGNRKGVRII